jgi:3-oxoacyl-[acyl-carrier protein] reductase
MAASLSPDAALQKNASQSLDHRHVLVTGGSRGLGRAMVLGLLRAGARVTAIASRVSAQSDETLARAASLLASERIAMLFGDLRSIEDCRRMAGEAASFGPVDMIVNNAAIPMAGPGLRFFEADLDSWHAMVRTNIDGSVLLTTLLVPGMLARGFGRIVNISTGAATMVRARYSPYGPSKAFIEAMTRIWAEELAGTGVTANVLLPGGAVDTAADVTGASTLGRQFLDAAVMVPPLLWLASAESQSHTGLRLNAKLWDESLPLTQRLAQAESSRKAEPCIM